ncbi:MAG: sigma-54 dependent transcriptional regulator [bacterium]|nr:sigma-54-dependent Fis family transcriptional regulator [Myxococcales bacterium]
MTTPEAPARFGRVIGHSAPMRAIFQHLERIASSELTVLIQGETGTGKELIAHAIHTRSDRRDRPFVVVDCSAIPRDLIESTLFGHERGAFTGAVAQHRGLFEQADGGTIFLDEIGELDIALQPRLLRVLENRELKRVGGDRTLHIDVRVLAATNRDLRQMVDDGRFREDLYYRLGVVPVRLPALRERRADIPLLIDEFLRELDGAARPTLSEDALDALIAYDWPGNIRQLKNAVIRARSLADGPTLGLADLLITPAPSAPPAPIDPDADLRCAIDARRPFKDAKQDILDAFEAIYLRRLLTAHDGNISACARTAGLTRYHLRELLKKHRLR